MQSAIKYLFAIVFATFGAGVAHGQTSPLSVVNKLPNKFLHPCTELCEKPLKIRKKRSSQHWVAFSDSDQNTTFADPFGRRELDQLNFLDPVLVLRHKNGYCKVIAYAPKVIEGGNFLVGNNKLSFRLRNREEVQYKGWIPEDHLVHSPHAQACGHTLQPVKWYAGINNPRFVAKRDEYLDKDSLLLAKAPGYRKEKNTKTPFNDWLYVFKRLENPSQFLVGTVPFIDKDSLQGTFGWVRDSAVVPLAQNIVLMPRKEAFAGVCSRDSLPLGFDAKWTDEFQPEGGIDTSSIDLSTETLLEGQDWFIPGNIPLGPRMDSVESSLRTFAPIELVDLRNSRIYNCLGKPLSYSSYIKLQKELHTVNLLTVFEDGEEGKKAMGDMISSFQGMYQLSRKNKMDAYKLNFGAVGYNGRQISDTLSWTNSFSQWIDFIQQRTRDTIEYRLYEHVMLRGVQEAARMLEGHQREHNVVMVVGSKIDAETFKDLHKLVVPKLAKVNASLVFVQSNRGKAQNYSDFVLQAKRILSDVARASAIHRKQIIIDNSLVRYKSEFTPENRCGNGSLFDFPERSMVKGGLFFPQAGDWMCPDLLQWVMDSLFTQIKWDTEVLLADIEENFKTMGRLEQEVNPKLKKILVDQSIAGMPDSVTNTFNDPFYIEAKTQLNLEHPCCSPYEPGFLFHEDEFDALMKTYRKVVLNPRLDRKGDSQIDAKDRKRWVRDLKHRYREKNQFFRFKKSARKASVAEIIFMETGLPVNSPFFHRAVLKDIASKNGIEQEELLPEIEYFYQSLFQLEEYPSTYPGSVVSRNDHQYFVIPAAKLP